MESPKRVDSIAKSFTEDPMGRQGLSIPLIKIHEGRSDQIVVMFAVLSRSMKNVIDTVDSFRNEMKENAKKTRGPNDRSVHELKELKEARITRISRKMRKNFEAESLRMKRMQDSQFKKK